MFMGPSSQIGVGVDVHGAIIAGWFWQRCSWGNHRRLVLATMFMAQSSQVGFGNDVHGAIIAGWLWRRYSWNNQFRVGIAVRSAIRATAAPGLRDKYS
jgi:hypothetical protein